MAMSLSETSNIYPRTKTWLSVWLSFMLLLVSILHNVELNTTHYPQKNELVLIEFTLLLIVILFGSSHFFSSLYYLINHNRRELQQSVTCFIIILSTLIIAIFIDAETLLYAT
jgi:cation transport ATPase